MADSILLLLVEDETLIRLNLQEELTGVGFVVVAAANGNGAMASLSPIQRAFVAS